MKMYSFALPILVFAAITATTALVPASDPAARAGAGRAATDGIAVWDADLHFELKTSAPRADSTVAPTSTVQLWFTQVPQAGTTQIRVMKGEVVVPMSDAAPDPEDPKSYLVTIERPLSPGAYRVMWRSMAADGHVVDGDFGFTIAAAEPAVR
jgi:methionine-rich copper-binding protein CopC